MASLHGSQQARKGAASSRQDTCNLVHTNDLLLDIGGGWVNLVSKA